MKLSPEVSEKVLDILDPGRNERRAIEENMQAYDSYHGKKKSAFAEACGMLSMVALIGLCLYGVKSCVDYQSSLTFDYKSHTIVEIGQCSNATSNAFSGRQEGQCAVKLDNGQYLTLPAPTVVVGKQIFYYKSTESINNWQLCGWDGSRGSCR